ncbi:PIN-like domain-containing protein [Rhizobacter sp. P5_C2]
MKSTFRGYYRPSEEEFTELWKTCVFVLDANVLLNMYGYSGETRIQLLALLRSIEQRLWVPHQFAREYQRNRAKSISEQVTSYSTAHTELLTLLDQRLRVKHRHPFVPRRSLSDLKRICAELEAGRKEHELLFSNDPIFGVVSQMLAGRVGAAPTAEEYSVRCTEARNRYPLKIPPGYSDSKKPEPDAFGDYFGWKEILAYGRAKNTPAILITDDHKEDWWHIFNRDRRLGPRPELLAEYWDACQQPFYMYTLEEFMRYAEQHLQQRVTPEALEEVRERSESQTESDVGDKPKTEYVDSEKALGSNTSFSNYSSRDELKSSESPEKPVTTPKG